MQNREKPDIRTFLQMTATPMVSITPSNWQVFAPARGAGRVALLATFCLLVTNAAHADIVLSSNSNDQDNAQIARAAEMVAEGKIDQARNVLSRLESQPNQVHPEIMLVELLMQAGQEPLARATLEKFSATSGPRFDLMLAYAKLALHDGRFFDAFVHGQYAKGQSMPRNWTQPYRARMLQEVDVVLLKSITSRGNWAHASSLVAKYANDETASPELREFAALCEFHQGRSLQAFNIYQALAESNTDAPNGYLAIARLYDSQQKALEAEKFFKRATQVAGQEDLSKLEYARWLIWQNRPDESQAVLDDVDVETHGVERKFLEALAARMQQQFPRALRLLSELCEATPDSVPFRNHHALVLAESNDATELSKAQKIALQLVQEQPRNGDLWGTLGWIQLKLDQVDEAQQSLARASSSGSVSRDVAHYLIELHRRLGNEESVTELEEKARNATGPIYYVTQESVVVPEAP